MLIHNPGAYVLFGEKPMAEVSYYTRCSGWELMQNPYNYQIKLGWETWKKYRHLFPLKNYRLIEIEDLEMNVIHIFLISRSRFMDVFKKHKLEFDKMIGKQLSPDEALEWCASRFNQIAPEGKMTHFLLGILFGFGSENSKLFERLRTIEDHQRSFQSDPIHPNPPFITLEGELSWLEKKLFFSTSQGDSSPLVFIPLPQFAADLDSKETQQLRESYSEQRRKICQEYGQGNFLEITFKELTSPRS